MLINERDNRHERILHVAKEMMTAARTAPKGRGVDILEIAMVTGETIKLLSAEMWKYGERTGMKFLFRDSENILNAEAILLIGTRTEVQGLNCGYCGFDKCEEKLKHTAIPCAINSTDVGIAIGSAVSVAADRRVDCRVMFSVGRVAKDLNLLSGCSNIYGIPLSCSSKNPFFDRKPKEEIPPAETIS